MKKYKLILLLAVFMLLTTGPAFAQEDVPTDVIVIAMSPDGDVARLHKLTEDAFQLTYDNGTQVRAFTCDQYSGATLEYEAEEPTAVLACGAKVQVIYRSETSWGQVDSRPLRGESIIDVIEDKETLHIALVTKTAPTEVGNMRYASVPVEDDILNWEKAQLGGGPRRLSVAFIKKDGQLEFHDLHHLEGEETPHISVSLLKGTEFPIDLKRIEVPFFAFTEIYPLPSGGWVFNVAPDGMGALTPEGNVKRITCPVVENIVVAGTFQAESGQFDAVVADFGLADSQCVLFLRGGEELNHFTRDTLKRNEGRPFAAITNGVSEIRLLGANSTEMFSFDINETD